jgi:hypothetical protein
MKSSLLISLAVLALFACSSSAVSEGDLEGKTFQAKLDIPKNANSNNPMAALMLAMMANMKAKYSFKNNNTGVYTAEAGTMATNQDFTWTIENDTLKIDPVNGSEAKSSRYFIQAEETGYTLKDSTVTVHLTKE